VKIQNRARCPRDDKGLYFTCDLPDRQAGRMFTRSSSVETALEKIQAAAKEHGIHVTEEEKKSLDHALVVVRLRTRLAEISVTM
jgi:hypothetical protein